MAIVAWEVVLETLPATHTPSKVYTQGEILKSTGRLYPPVTPTTDQNG